MINHKDIEKYLNGKKINYDKEMKKHVEQWRADEIKPSLLLHSCCAPCSTYALEYLSNDCDITIYFSNSNIYPKSEYERRALVQKKFITDFNSKNAKNIKFIEAEYRPNEFIEMVYENKLENELEGGKRCTACFDLRLDEVARFAKNNGYDYFGTAISLSPHKNSQQVNAVAYEIQKIYDVQFLPSDFKKNNGYNRSVEMCREYDIYRQCYCGCVFSAKEHSIDLKSINEDAIEFLKENK